MLNQILVYLACVILGFSIQLVINGDTDSVISKITKTSIQHISCGQHEKENLVINPSFRERINGKLEPATIKLATSIFRKCGAVAISEAVSHQTVDDFRYHLTNMMSPLMESRERVKEESRYISSWDQLSHDTKDELFLASGEAIRERQSGRLDLLLPHTMPFNSSEVVLNRFSIDILNGIFDNEAFELKSVHGVTSLPNTKAQKWHRDDGPLFPTGIDHEDLASKASKSINVYAVNAFIALNTVKLNSGPTEYMLGSHLETNKAMEETLGQEHQAVAFEWPKGSLVLMDYRTCHRGGPNQGKDPRMLAMLVYGRLWWRDAVNYMGDNYGGLERTPDLFSRNERELSGQLVELREARVVSRRLAQRHMSDPNKQEEQRKSMYEYCRVLWN